MNFRGQQTPNDGGSEYNAQAFIIQQMLGRLSTATLVKIVAVTNTGGISPVGYVDVLPLVNQVDGNGNATPHEIIHGVPYFRLQGGANALVLDPEVNDIGMAAFADHDINSVKENKDQSNPGSWRRFSMADAMYFGGFLNAAPTQYVQFSANGIKVHSPTLITLEAPDVKINSATLEINATTSVTITTPTFTVNGASVLNGTLAQTGGGSSTMSGSLTATGDVIGNGKSLHNHTHNVASVQGGGSTLPTTTPN